MLLFYDSLPGTYIQVIPSFGLYYNKTEQDYHIRWFKLVSNGLQDAL